MGCCNIIIESQLLNTQIEITRLQVCFDHCKYKDRLAQCCCKLDY